MIFEEKKIKEDIYSKSFEITIDDLKFGVNSFEDFFIIKKGDEQFMVFDRICDHNGGKLISKNNTNEIICPLHGWKLNALDGNYLNAKVKKKEIEYKINQKKIKFNLNEKKPKFTKFDDIIEIEIFFLNHSCLVFKTKKFSFAIDPWIFGPAFLGGWWLKKNSPSNSFKLLDDCDFIFISHNHPDHLHDLTLSKIRSDMKYFVSNFKSSSTLKYLDSLGKKNIENLDFGSEYINKNFKFVISPMKSGDFRDDSGIYFSIGNFKAIIAVDTNSINFLALPDNISFLASSFAGGASGYPICFDNYNNEEKKNIISRNNNALFARNNKLISLSKPKFYMPYASFFSENAKRDIEIKKMNNKISIKKYEDFFKNQKLEILNVDNFQNYHFKGEQLIKKSKNKHKLNDIEIESFIEDQKKFYNKISEDKISNYFLNSKFNSDIILFIDLSNDSFDQVINSFYVDFSKSNIDIEFSNISSKTKYHISKDKKLTKNLIYMSVRSDAFSNVIENMLPWEDMLIGFQLRIQRYPDVYNSDFWYHFTNIYVKSSRYSSIKQCNHCDNVLQKLDQFYMEKL